MSYVSEFDTALFKLGAVAKRGVRKLLTPRDACPRKHLFGLFRRRRDFISDLDTPLLKLNAQGDDFTLRDAVGGGLLALGSTGSGKTSGPGKALAEALLRTGAGFLVLAAKPEEVSMWQRYAAANGRSNSLVLFDETQGFNFLAHELGRQGVDGIGSVIEYLMRIIEVSRRTGPAPASGGGDPFWLDAIKQMLMYTIPVLYAANGTVSIPAIIAFVTSAPTTQEQLVDEAFRESNLACQTLRRACGAPAVPLDDVTFEACSHYWLREYPAIPARTRGNVVISLSTSLGRFTHGRLQRAFCGETTIAPEMCFNGAIIIMAMPVRTWNEDGLLGQVLFKAVFQRVVESRNALAPEFRERPLVLWADEAHLFCDRNDGEFISTCRSSRTCTVFLSQNLPTFYAGMGDAATHAADSLIGQFGTFVFCRNSCPKSNSFASSLIGRGIHRRATYNEGQGANRNAGMNTGSNVNRGASSSSGGSWSQGQGSSSWSSGSNHGSGENWGDNRGVATSENVSQGYSEVMENLIEPAWLSTGLISGGPENRNRVTAVWFQSGGNFRASGGGSVLFTMFRQ